MNNNDICSDIANLVEKTINLNQWGFQETWRMNEFSTSNAPFLIYQSQLCKLKISFNEWSPPHQTQDYTIDMYYGRLSALNDKNIVGKGGDACHCWHSIARALHFLDGRDAAYTAKKLLTHDRIKKFMQAVSSSDLVGKLPEWEIQKHAYIWEEYAPRLFELFDINNAELWEKYRQFLKEVYDIKGRNPIIIPSLDKVC